MGQTLPLLRFSSVASAPSALPVSNDAPIFSLPAALVQSVMHFCSAAEIFSLSRCSTRLYRDGGEPFAWEHADIRLTADRALPQPTLLQRMYASSKHALSMSTSLVPRLSRPAFVRLPFLDHARISVSWPIAGPAVLCAELDHAVLPLLDRIPSVHAFTSSIVSVAGGSNAPRMLAVDAFCIILRHPAMRSLTSLHLYDAFRPGYASKPLIDAISALPILTHLDLNVHAGAEDEDAAWESIAACPALTRLHVLVNHARRRLAYVSQCPLLTELSLTTPSLYGDRFRAFLMSDHMRRLVTLRLDWLCCGGFGTTLGEVIPPTDFAEVFALMTRLEEIQLTRVYDIDALLPHLASAPALRLCVIQPQIQTTAGSLVPNSSLPSESAVRSLLDAARSLHLRLLLRGSLASSCSAVSVASTPPVLGPVSPLLAALKQSYPQRFEAEPDEAEFARAGDIRRVAVSSGSTPVAAEANRIDSIR